MLNFNYNVEIFSSFSVNPEELKDPSLELLAQGVRSLQEYGSLIGAVNALSPQYDVLLEFLREYPDWVSYGLKTYIEEHVYDAKSALLRAKALNNVEQFLKELQDEEMLKDWRAFIRPYRTEERARREIVTRQGRNKPGAELGDVMDFLYRMCVVNINMNNGTWKKAVLNYFQSIDLITIDWPVEVKNILHGFDQSVNVKKEDLCYAYNTLVENAK